MKKFCNRIAFIQNAFRRKKAIKKTKRDLLNDLWDKFIEKSKVNAQNLDMLQRQFKSTKTKTGKASIQA